MAVDANVSGNTIALIVGLGAAAATAVVGLVNDRQQRRHHRDNLALDVELAKLLKDGSAAKQILDGFITSEIRRIAVRGYTEDKRRLRNSVFVFVLAASITVLGIDAASNSHEIRQCLFWAAVVSGLLSLILAAVVLQKEHQKHKKLKRIRDA
ncbi:hypothetical protein QDT91_08835 [Mycolicibacterium aubagnense]|uniref:hypothetical protein n=1 Tax=Mycolicibacterium aubagnense TaxID=319707 RepID=UPI0010FD6426|nr:hypothetical protein [Mycolicibacterium aubagnense]TLH59712.1 hypothetical protein C1S80_19725 [Mycolicibacterium aubagnense]WGI34425.1 hypothetical protein QDT91_08835 [Mycolicibacterium aubagnense]